MKKWEKKEQNDARDFGGKRTPGSGNKWNHKGDVRSDVYLIEDKTTDKKSYTITNELWRKIYNSAILSQRIPLLSIKFNNDSTELIVISKHDFLHLSGNEAK